MKLLLDTHTFLWLIEGHPALSSRAQAALMDPENLLFLSVVSMWEMAIKMMKPREALRLNEPLEDYLQRWLPAYDIQTLAVLPPHILALFDLPDYHHDPFDRLLIAQARYEEMRFVTADSKCGNYPVETLW